MRTRFSVSCGGMSGRRWGQFACRVGNAGGEIGIACARGDAWQGSKAKRMGDIGRGFTGGKPLAQMGATYAAQ